ncbi:Collagen triple helix repeat-containing protein [Strongyloides ratti]|uniref:Collagen triple helix repeat-containing protein n=1 Tax=Strongyloides ratti TaxID=34506 RepID=A0A090LHH0_STRRB|nr:Collagen triple helix repeat-containing protein [Strongyloides ratti]CEF69216.1 Collagen triple helix repeat-containing protein [Strongyloides ratti]
MYFTAVSHLSLFSFIFICSVFCITTIGITISLMSYEFSSIVDIVNFEMKNFNNDANIAFEVLLSLERDNDNFNVIFKRKIDNIEKLTNENKEVFFGFLENNRRQKKDTNNNDQIAVDASYLLQENYNNYGNDKYPVPQSFVTAVNNILTTTLDDGYVTPSSLLPENIYNTLPPSNTYIKSKPEQCPLENTINPACPPGPPGKDGKDGYPGFHGVPGIPGRDGINSNSNGMYVDKDISMCFQCPVGSPGPKGPKGQTGNPGAKGAIGARGQAGKPGNNGYPGIQGKMGPPGMRGKQGERGKQGKEGYHYYGLPKKGPKGIPGKQGLAGMPGIPGLHGSRGRTGVPGPRGNSGLRGRVGKPGKKGPQGPVGTVGPDRLYCECKGRSN